MEDLGLRGRIILKRILNKVETAAVACFKLDQNAIH